METIQTMTREQLRLEIYKAQGYELQEFTFGNSSPRPAWGWAKSGDLSAISFSPEDAERRLIQQIGDPLKEFKAAMELFAEPDDTLLGREGSIWESWILGKDGKSDITVCTTDMLLSICLAWYQWKTGVQIEIVE